MNFPTRSLPLLILALSLAGSISLSAQEFKNLGQTSSDWNGVNFIITNVVREKEKQIRVTIRIDAGPNTLNGTFIGILPPEGLAPEGSPMDVRFSDAHRPRPFTFAAATLTDPSTHIVYKVAEDPEAVITTVQPNTWFQIKVRFDAPPPPPADANGKTPPQKVTFTLPKAKDPIRDVELPPN